MLALSYHICRTKEQNSDELMVPDPTLITKGDKGMEMIQVPEA